jgi:hypothetical protein
MTDELDLFTQPPEPEPRAHARRHDRHTSHEAAAAVTPTLSQRQSCVLDCLRMFTIPVAEVEWIPRYKRLQPQMEWIPQGDSGLRTRREELVTRGKVVDRGTLKIGKRHHTLWEVTP